MPHIYRCVLNWFGDWSTGALYQVGKEFTNKVDLERGDVSSFNVDLRSKLKFKTIVCAIWMTVGQQFDYQVCF